LAEQIKSVRGTKDITPDEVYKWHYVEAIAKEVFERFGFREIRTPIFEHTELFIKGTGRPQILSRRRCTPLRIRADEV